VFGTSFAFARLWGSPLRVDLSWLPIAALAAWTMAGAVAPSRHPELSAGGWWAMGAAGALALFASALVHELGHLYCSRRLGVDPRTVTLYPFGGIAELAEPPHARADLAIAVAGPAASGALALAGWGLATQHGWVAELGFYVAVASGAVAVVNLLPAFPLDGGRVLRAWLWERRGCLRTATLGTAHATNAAGLGLAACGLAAVLVPVGPPWLGPWLLAFGLVLVQGARLAYRQLVLRRALSGEPVSRFMDAGAPAVARGTSARELAAVHFAEPRQLVLAVVDHEGRLVGCVSRQQVAEVPEEERDCIAAGELAAAGRPCVPVADTADALEVLAAMAAGEPVRPVVDAGDRLVGLVSRSALVKAASQAVEREL
jgi:Zn-dependent protease